MKLPQRFVQRFGALLCRLGKLLVQGWNLIRPLPSSVTDEFRRCEMQAYFADGLVGPRKLKPKEIPERRERDG